MILQVLLVTSIVVIQSQDQDEFLDARKHRRPIIQTEKLTLAEYPSYNLIEPDG